MKIKVHKYKYTALLDSDGFEDGVTFHIFIFNSVGTPLFIYEGT